MFENNFMKQKTFEKLKLSEEEKSMLIGGIEWPERLTQARSAQLMVEMQKIVEIYFKALPDKY